MNTMQQEFDAVATHLIKQGKPSMTERDTCAYRGMDNTSCAVGCRIPDDMYHPQMDAKLFGMGVVELTERYTVPKEINKYLAMFRDLQDVHDSCAVEDGKFVTFALCEGLKSVAKNFNLTFTEPAV